MAEITRRELLQRAGVLVGGAAVGSAILGSTLQAGPLAYDQLAQSDWLSPLEVMTRVPTEKFFTEGPAADGSGKLYFTNLPTPATAQILRWDTQSKKLEVFREPTNAANGLLFDPQGRLLTCEGGLNEDGRVTRTDVSTGKITVLADAYMGHPLGAPNDLTLDSRGRIFFTSRLANTDLARGNVNAVYRIDPDGTLTRVLAAPEIDMPNGIVTTADDKTLYLVESDGRENRSRCIRAYDLKEDGTLANGRVLITFYPGRSGDGMCVDASGNLYIAAGLHNLRATKETLDTKPGIHVVSPQGKLLAYVPTPEDTITNCTFGGDDLRTLYVTSGPWLLSGRTRIPGKPAYRIGK